MNLQHNNNDQRYIYQWLCGKPMNLQHINNDQRYIYQSLCVKRMNLQHINNDQRYIYISKFVNEKGVLATYLHLSFRGVVSCSGMFR